MEDNMKELLSEPILERNKLLEKFYNHFKEYHSKKELENKRDDITKAFNYLIKKLHSIPLLRDNGEFITDIKWEKFVEFYHLLRHIKKSDERKIRWAIFNIFSSGKQNITIKELNSSLEGLEISNLENMIKKIFEEAKFEGMNGSFDGSQIIINHKTSDDNIAHYLVEAVEYVSRRSPGELENGILNLLDEGSYSNQEITEILDADKAMVSKTMSKLRELDKKIVISSFGERGTRYYTTDCDNCPWGLERKACKRNAISYIIDRINDEFGVKLTEKDFDSVKTNQAILAIKSVFMLSKKEQNTKLEQNLNENLSKILLTIKDRSVQQKTSAKSKKSLYVNLVPILSKLPILYQVGFYQGSQNGVNLMDIILGQALKSVNKVEREKIRKDIIQEFNRYLKTIVTL